ncbi:putative ribonuclease H-like domain-containing protein [Tanacetum coccineum]
MVNTGVLTRTGLITPVKQNEKRAVHKVSTARPVSTAMPFSTVRPFAPKIAQTSDVIRPIYPRMDNGNPEILLQDHAVVDSGCSSHMTGNKAYLSDYEDYNGGFVAFGSDPKGGKITGKGKIKTANLDFDDVYFVDELKFNLFSVSQMCDKKNSVLFTESECLILSPSFKLLDESQVVLRAPRKDDVYSLDLKNIVPSGGITCLYANATADESKLWHRRLGHVNFKNINKLVKGHLVRGLPSKVFVNDHTCVACKKGKQHKASCKAKLERIIRKPLELLHMDLFGPVSVESINKKRCAEGDVVLRQSYKPESYGKLYYACPKSKPPKHFGCGFFLWKETRLRELMSSPGAPSYSAGHSTPPSYSSGPSTPPSYSSGPSTPTNYSLGSSRNRECSNCKHLRGKISVLKATMEMHMHPEQHTVNSAALFHEVLNEMEKLDLE